MTPEGDLKDFFESVHKKKKCFKYTELNNIRNKLPWE